MDPYGQVTLPLIWIVMVNILFFDAQIILKPSNVTLTSFNNSAVLTWASPATQIANITYTAQYSMGKKSEFKSKCIDVKGQCCDFGKLPSTFGIYTFRVRAHLQGHTSAWVTGKDSKPVIGPPAVSMVLRDGVMELNITDPEYKICNLSHFWLNDVAYNITYWRQHQENETWQRTVQQRSIRLPVSVLPSETLCVQVCLQFKKTFPVQKCLPSTPVCALNPPHGEAQQYVHSSTALVGCLASLALLSVLMLSWCVYKGRNFLHPNATLPQPLIQCDLEMAVGLAQVFHTEEQYEHISCVWEPPCESVCMSEDRAAVGGSDGVSSVLVYESLSIVCVGSETVFDRMAEPTQISSMLEPTYYNMLP